MRCGNTPLILPSICSVAQPQARWKVLFFRPVSLQNQPLRTILAAPCTIPRAGGNKDGIVFIDGVTYAYVCTKWRCMLYEREPVPHVFLRHSHTRPLVETSTPRCLDLTEHGIHRNYGSCYTRSLVVWRLVHSTRVIMMLVRHSYLLEPWPHSQISTLCVGEDFTIPSTTAPVAPVV